MLRSLAILLVATLSLAGPSREEGDIENPRAPGTPLEITFAPFWCSACAPDTPGFAEPKAPVTLLRAAPEKLAGLIELDDNWLVIRSPHFTIMSTLRRTKVKMNAGRFVPHDLERLKAIFPKLRVGSRSTPLDAHERAHLYHIRAERLYAHFHALTGIKEAFLGMLAPYELYLFDDYAEHHALVDKFIGRANDKAGIQDHQRDKPNYMLFTTAESQVAENDGRGDAIFANHFIHNVAHLLADGSHNYYRETWAWLEEGLAHYYERMENPKHNTFCWTEGKKPDDLLKADWHRVIHSQVRRGKDTPLSEWCEKLQPGELTAVEHGLCWSIVSWLVETEPLRLAKLMTQIDDLKKKPTASQSIEYAFGVAPTVLHQRWREWVMEKGR